MSRLADYFAIVGYSHEKDNNNVCCGKVLQRFPEKDWSDCPFMSGLPLFCQPMGWALSRYQKQPSFYVAMLTDMDGERHYCAVFTFYEMIASPLSKPDDEEDDHDRNNMHQSTLFAPKSLVLVSRHDYFEAFRNCLSVIYTVFLDNMAVKIESLVGNMLGCIHVPPAGGPQVRFSLGAGDRQVLQPPLSASLPLSNISVAILFEQLGINNTLTVFSAALTDHKIVFYSESCSRLCEASRAIASLHYPLKYTYVFIPVLPASLLEVLNSPTPFIAGVHASLRENIADLLDVITVDLDGGSVRIPECVSVPSITEEILVRVKQALTMILNPSLQYADDAFSAVSRIPSPLALRDKELRAVFIRMFAELFCGYRSSLAVVRIHPSPIITFHKSHFLGQRDMAEESFLGRLLDGMAFNAFVAERGPPYRVCDIFDEVSATIQDQLQEEVHDPQRLMENIRELAHHLYMNECTQQQPFVPLVPEPADGVLTRTNQPPFPILDATLVQDVINEGINNNSSKRLGSSRPQKMRIVPVSGSQGSWSRQRTLENNTRRLEVVRNCVNLIFENKITEAAKIFPAVLRALKSKVVRLALTRELGEQVRNNRSMLEHQQFDLVVRLLNCALMNDSSLDENGVAAAILPLATAFYRKLCQGVIQFAYTLIQEHAVWENLQFWEQSFYQDVQSQIHQLYLPMYEEHMLLMSKSTDSTEDFNENAACGTSSSLRPKKKIGPLEITAEQLRVWASMSPEEQQEMVSNEESTVYSQAIHYAYRMVYLRVPLDASRSFKNIIMEENSSIVTPSVAESDSFDAESGFDETEHADVAAVVTKFVSRFVDKVCSEAGVTEGHFKSLQQLVPGIVAMHIETLEGVNRESKQLPPVPKPRILQPLLLPGEEIVMEGLRAYLLPDGREEGAGGNMGGPSLLPSEGAVFLTTYRVIFKGIPCDPFACEKTVMRSFPVSSLSKQKKISLQHYMPQGLQGFHDGVQLRSTVFQLMKIAFDGEVSPDSIEAFSKLVHKVRYPTTVFHAFAFSGYTVHPSTQMRQKSKENISLREFAKQKILKTARKAGLKKHSKTKLRHSIALSHRDGDQSPHSSDSETESAVNAYGDLRVLAETDLMPTYSNDPKNIERLMERHAYQDYQRLGLGSVAVPGQRGGTSDQFRVSTVNANYMLSKSYPGLLVVPQAVSDDSIRKFCRCNRHSRFPVITWRHPKTRALLLRASSFHSRSLGTMLRHNTTASSCSTGDSSSTLELGKYFSQLISATPSNNGNPLSSLDLLIKAKLTAESLGNSSPADFRSSGTQGSSIDKRVSSTSPRISSPGRNQEPSRSPNISRRQHTTLGAVSGELINHRMKHMSHVALYVFGEKSHMKGLKTEASLRCDFIPVDLCEVRQVKASFKKLMRACVPSSPLTSTDSSFHKAVEDSEWLQQLMNILQLSGAVVDLIDDQGSSVMICLEDGWDITTQVVSLAQLMMDPYYRTIEGFRTLIEKEWLGFGHRFSHRNSQTATAQASGFAPIFLQFLDAVHQVHRQFPLSFEFSEYFLRYLAYHCVSSRFRTFMFDSELDRVESGWLLEEQGVGFSDHDLEHQSHVSSLLEPSQLAHSETNHGLCGGSLWDHIDKLCKQSPVFFNVAYAMEDQDPILRPFANISKLKIWSFFTTEDLRHGALYDLDLMEDALGEDLECGRGGTVKRKTLNACYHTVSIQQPDFFWYQIQEIQRLEAELGRKSSPWRTVFDRLECPARDQISQRVSQKRKVAWLHNHTLQRRSTLEILMQGKMLGDIAHMFSQPHRFERHMYTSSTYCDHCSKVLWGLSKTGFKCVDCGYNCHDKCQSSVPKNCQKLKALGDPGLTAAQQQGDDSPDSTADYHAAKVFEHRTCTGYLYKQGQLFRQWKQRWFLLDTLKHQLRYYDTHDDHNCKGFIDLSEVESVSLLMSVPGAPKKAVDNSFIEIRAVRKVYNFMAVDSQSATDWVDKLQGCLQRE